MPPNGETVTDLRINSTPIEYGTATLRRTEATLPTGLLGSSDWRLELVHARLPDDEDVRVEVTAGGVAYSGAGRIADEEGQPSDRTVIVANGPLISYARPH